MAKSKIEWTDYTFNPWWGCTKVSPGCKNCYAEKQGNRFGEWWGIDAERRFFNDKHWNAPLKWNRKAEKESKQFKVFSGSMCDVFEDRDYLIEPRIRLFNLINHTKNLDWLLLTKRPENVLRTAERDALGTYSKNVWLGTSVETQNEDWRLRELLKIPAILHFVSIEPMLEEIDVSDWLIPGYELDYGITDPVCIDWVIVGGESGSDKRPFNPDWARSIRDQCKEAGIPFFMKQWDKVQPIPLDLMIREFPETQEA